MLDGILVEDNLEGDLVQDNITEIIAQSDYKTLLLFRQTSLICKNYVEKLGIKLLKTQEVALLEQFLDHYFYKIPEFEGFDRKSHSFKVKPVYRNKSLVIAFSPRHSYVDALKPGYSDVELEMKESVILAYLEMAKELAFDNYRMNVKLLDSNQLKALYDFLPLQMMEHLSVRTLNRLLNLFRSNSHMSDPKERAIVLSLIAKSEENLLKPYLSLQSRPLRDEFVESYIAYPQMLKGDKPRSTLLEHQSLEDLERLKSSLGRYVKTSSIEDFKKELDNYIEQRAVKAGKSKPTR